jgi:hypothetical protein
LDKFQVTFEDVGFTDDRRLGGTELDGEAIAAFNATNTPFASPVLELLGAHIAEDDHQAGKDIKVFVSIDLLIEAKSEDLAERIAPPTALLEKIQALLFQAAAKGVDMQGHWENTMAVGA